jgi:hypothetical protein
MKQLLISNDFAKLDTLIQIELLHMVLRGGMVDLVESLKKARRYCQHLFETQVDQEIEETIV